MKLVHLLLIIGFLLIPKFVICSDWDILQEGQKSTFQNQKMESIKCLFIDSIYHGTDSTNYYLNFKILDSLKNICKDNMQLQGYIDGNYTKQEKNILKLIRTKDSNFLIFPKINYFPIPINPRIGDKWTFRIDKKTFCEVKYDSIVRKIVFAIDDSVKIFRIRYLYDSTSYEYERDTVTRYFELSQHFGLLKYHIPINLYLSNSNGGGQEYNLIGLSHKDYQFGFDYPDYTNFFKWQVGDLRIVSVCLREIVSDPLVDVRLDSIIGVDIKDDYYILTYDSYYSNTHDPYGEFVLSQKNVKDSIYFPTFLVFMHNDNAFAGYDNGYIISNHLIKPSHNIDNNIRNIVISGGNRRYNTVLGKQLIIYGFGYSAEASVDFTDCESHFSTDADMWCIYIKDIGIYQKISDSAWDYVETVEGYRMGKEIAGWQGVTTNVIEELPGTTNKIRLIGDNIFLDNFDKYYNANYYIYNLLGETISRGKLTSDLIPIHNLDNGLYFLVLENQDKTERYKFIK